MSQDISNMFGYPMNQNLDTRYRTVYDNILCLRFLYITSTCLIFNYFIKVSSQISFQAKWKYVNIHKSALIYTLLTSLAINYFGTKYTFKNYQGVSIKNE